MKMKRNVGQRRIWHIIEKPFMLVLVWVSLALGALDNGAHGPGIPEVGTQFYINNHIGSAAIITNEAGEEVARLEYAPYGELLQDNLAGDPISTGRDNFREKFTGKEWDDEAGLYYYGARYYSPVTGRFVGADDQIGMIDAEHPAALNRYAYAGNQPVTNVDVDGHSGGFLGRGMWARRFSPTRIRSTIRDVRLAAKYAKQEVGFRKAFRTLKMAWQYEHLQEAAGWPDRQKSVAAAISQDDIPTVPSIRRPHRSHITRQDVMMARRRSGAEDQALWVREITSGKHDVEGLYRANYEAIRGPYSRINILRGTSLSKVMKDFPYHPRHTVNIHKVEHIVNLMLSDKWKVNSKVSNIWDWNKMRQPMQLRPFRNGGSLIWTGTHRMVAAWIAGVEIPEGVVKQGPPLSPFWGMNKIQWKDLEWHRGAYRWAGPHK